MSNTYGDPLTRLLTDREATASALVVGLTDSFGTEFLNWEPDTLIHEIKETWRVMPPEFNRDKIWALSGVMTTDLFTKDLSFFNHVCNALSGSGASFELFVPCDVTEICWAISEIAIMDPDELKNKFAPDIQNYIRLKLEDEGIQRMPKILSRFVSVPDKSQEITDSLQNEEIDFKAFWNDQDRKLLTIDQAVTERMMQLLSQVASLRLKNAAHGSQKDLLQRAQKVLVKQYQRTEREQAQIPLAASL